MLKLMMKCEQFEDVEQMKNQLTETYKELKSEDPDLTFEEFRNHLSNVFVLDSRSGECTDAEQLLR